MCSTHWFSRRATSTSESSRRRKLFVQAHSSCSVITTDRKPCLQPQFYADDTHTYTVSADRVQRPTCRVVCPSVLMTPRRGCAIPPKSYLVLINFMSPTSNSGRVSFSRHSHVYASPLHSLSWHIRRIVDSNVSMRSHVANRIELFRRSTEFAILVLTQLDTAVQLLHVSYSTDFSLSSTQPLEWFSLPRRLIMSPQRIEYRIWRSVVQIEWFHRQTYSRVTKW